MNDYLVFGGCLRSALPFPGLPSASHVTPDWLLERLPDENAGAAGDSLAPLGTAEVAGGPVTMYRSPTGFELHYHDTGRFHVSNDGRRIAWTPRPGCDEDAARLDVTSRVLGVAMHAAGMLCLHGSAVTIGREAITFLAPKHCGKSTLATALVNAGARLLTDDTLPVTLGDPVRAVPGVHHLRLWDDSWTTVGPGARSGDEPAATGRARKQVMTAIAEERLAQEPAPLAAIYLLSPSRTPQSASDGPAVRRTRLDTIQATVSLVRHARNGDLLGGAEAGRLLDRSAELAARVPVYLLEYERAWSRLGDVVATLGAWHGMARAASVDDVAGSLVA